jgi:hypothetical protein
VVNVPSAYDAYIKQMSAGTGIPYSVIAAQANAESGFDPKAVSSAGAEGWLQFLPSTYDAVASQAGVKPGSEFDPASEAKAYVVYMNQLLKQEGGNLRNTLAAYNAGPGNLSAGYGYADSILKAAGQGDTTVTTPASASTTGISIPGVGGLSVSGIIDSAIKSILGSIFGGPLRDFLERAGLIILGFALVILGIHLLGQTDNAKTYIQNQRGSGGSGGSEEETEPKSTTKKAAKTAETGGKGVGAEEAVEAAAVA